METPFQCAEAVNKIKQMSGTGRKQRTKSTYNYATIQPVVVVSETVHAFLASLPPQGCNGAGKRSGKRQKELSKSGTASVKSD